MLVVLLSVLVTVVAGGMVVAYVAYPQRDRHRDRDVPTAVRNGRRQQASAADAGRDD